jgi:hypothetical protein
MKSIGAFLAMLLSVSALALDLHKSGTGFDTIYSVETSCGTRQKIAHRFPYLKILNNPDKTIWAMSYHDSTSYDGVDIISEHKCRLTEFDDIFSLTKKECERKYPGAYNGANRIRAKAINIRGKEIEVQIFLIPLNPSLKTELKAIFRLQFIGTKADLQLKELFLVKPERK